MESTISKFLQLPHHVKSALSSAEAIEKLEQIEKAHDISLADVVMRVAVKSIQISELEDRLQAEFGVSYDSAKQIKEDLLHNVFSQIGNYLGIPDPAFQKNLTVAEHTSLGVDERDAEIAHHENTLRYVKPMETEYDAEEVTKTIEQKIEKTFDHVLHKRLKKIVESRLVDARDSIDIRNQLIRPEKIGGIGLSESVVDTILPIIEEAWKTVHDLHLHVKREEAFSRVAKTKKVSDAQKHPEISAQHIETHLVMPPKKQDEPKITPLPVQPLSAPHATPVNMPSVQTMPVNLQMKPVILADDEIKMHEPENIVTPPVFATPPPKREPLQAPKKEISQFMPKMQRRSVLKDSATIHDIKAPSKLVGPVEELEQMTIQDFRNLGENITESSERIKEKIRHLERESFELRSQGVKGWRKSPIMQQYLEVGRESMELGKSVSAIISERQQAKKETISEEEFDMLGKVNNDIRY